MYLTIARDAFFGGVLAGAFSYASTLYTTNANYLRVTAFLWGLPLIYFYILNIAWNTAGREAAFDVSVHGLLGIIITLFSIIFTLFIVRLNKEFIIYLNIMILITAIFSYTYYKVYNIPFRYII